MNLKDRAEKLKTDIPAIFIALKNKNTPMTAKIFAAITVAYALSPVDLIPDFIPVIGYLDDIIILPLLAAVTIKFIPNDILEKSREESTKIWQSGKPSKWYYAIPMVLVWAIIILIVIKMVL